MRHVRGRPAEGRSMSNALSHPTSRAAVSRPSRPIPLGFGLLIAGGVSIGLWVGLFRLGAGLLG